MAVEELRKLLSGRLLMVGTSCVVVKELLGITLFLSKSVSYFVHPEVFQQQSFTPADLTARGGVFEREARDQDPLHLTQWPAEHWGRNQPNCPLYTHTAKRVQYILDRGQKRSELPNCPRITVRRKK